MSDYLESEDAKASLLSDYADPSEIEAGHIFEKPSRDSLHEKLLGNQDVDITLNDFAEKKKYQSSIQTIASIANTMMGTTILALPFGVARAGIGASFFLIVFLGIVCCFTCMLVVKRTKQAGVSSFEDAVQYYLGKRVSRTSVVVSNCIILGAVIVYHILMQQTIYSIVRTFLVSSDGSASPLLKYWTRPVAALIPLVLYPVCNLKDLSVLVKLNSLGFLFMWCTVTFITSQGFATIASGSSLYNLISRATNAPPAFAEDGTLNVFSGFSSNIGALGGMMMLSFYLHTVVQPIIEHASPKTVYRDVSLGYSVAGFLYVMVGIAGYFGFARAFTKEECAHHIEYSPLPSEYSPLSLETRKCELNSNFVSLFPDEISSGLGRYAFSTRFSLLFQLCTVFPLLLLIVRQSVMNIFYNTTYPGFAHVAIHNGVIFAVSYAFAALNLQISVVLRYVGAIGGFIIVFLMPLAMDFRARKMFDNHVPWHVWLQIVVILGCGLLLFALQFR